MPATPATSRGSGTELGTIAFLGPAGTFTEEALFTQPDYAARTVLPVGGMAEVLEAVQTGLADLAFVPIENSIEGTVNAIVDSLIFDVDLLIQREVVLDIHMQLMAPPGADMGSIARVLSYPHASGQCRRFLAEKLPGAEVVPTNSTAEAARIVGEARRSDTAALAPRLAAELYGLEILASAVEDHPDNQTRFVALAPIGVPAPTGHDKTSIVCFQREDRPGSLHAILSEFAARSINLTKLESRPTKRGLGDYCFLIDLSGIWLTKSSLTAFGSSTPRSPGSSSSARTRLRANTGLPPVSRPARPGTKPTCGSVRCEPRSPRSERSAFSGPRQTTRTTLDPVRRDGRADECEALEKLWPTRPGGSNPPPSAAPAVGGSRATTHMGF
jgi:prephenate dehydratase